MCHVPQSNFVFSSVVVCSVPGGHYATQFKMTSPLYQCVKCQSEYTKGKPEIGTCHMCLHPGFHCSVRGQYEPFGRLDHGTVCWECEVPTPSGCAREGCTRAVYPRDVPGPPTWCTRCRTQEDWGCARAVVVRGEPGHYASQFAMAATSSDYKSMDNASCGPETADNKTNNEKTRPWCTCSCHATKRIQCIADDDEDIYRVMSFVRCKCDRCGPSSASGRRQCTIRVWEGLSGFCDRCRGNKTILEMIADMKNEKLFEKSCPGPSRELPETDSEARSLSELGDILLEVLCVHGCQQAVAEFLSLSDLAATCGLCVLTRDSLASVRDTRLQQIRVCSCGCGLRLRNPSSDWLRYRCPRIPRSRRHVHGYGQEDVLPSGSLRISCMWGAMDHCPSSAMLYNWECRDSLRQTSGWYRSKRGWHCPSCMAERQQQHQQRHP
jgi:hypothetical protein